MTGIVAGSSILLGAAIGWWSMLAVALAALLVVALGRERRTPGLWAVALAGALLGAGRSELAPNGSAAVLDHPDLTRATIVSVPVTGVKSQQFIVESRTQGTDGEAAPVRTCVVSGPAPKLRIGDVVRIAAEVEPARDSSARERAYLERRGCLGVAFARSVRIEQHAAWTDHPLAAARERLGDVLQSLAPGDEGVLLTGLVTGDDAALSAARKAAFKATGTTHLTAVSGSNLALAAGMLTTVGVAAFGRHRVIWQAVAIAGIWAYALVSGAQSPAVRAAIVATAAICAFRFGRKPDYPTLILLAAGGMVLVDPAQLHAIGFQLSVVSSLALAFVLPGMAGAGWRRAVAGALSATAAAQIATLPLLLAAFGTISLASLPANLLVAPLAAIVMPLAAAAALAGAIWLPVGEAIGIASVFGSRSMLAVVDRLGGGAASAAVGSPPIPAAIVIGLTCAALLFVLSEDGRRTIAGACKTRQSRPAIALAEAGIGGEAVALRVAPEGADARLAAPAAAVFGREDPADAPAADADDTVEDPARQEDGHEVADVWQRRETVSGDV